MARSPRRTRSLRHGNRIGRTLGRGRHEHRAVDLSRLRACQTTWTEDHRPHFRRHLFARKGLSEVSARDRPYRCTLSDAARHPRPALGAGPRHPLYRARYRADGAGRLQLRLHANQRGDQGRRYLAVRQCTPCRCQRRTRHRRPHGRLFSRYGGADEGLRLDAACASSRSDPHAGRNDTRDGDDQRRKGARARTRNRLARGWEARRYRHLRS